MYISVSSMEIYVFFNQNNDGKAQNKKYSVNRRYIRIVSVVEKAVFLLPQLKHVTGPLPGFSCLPVLTSILECLPDIVLAAIRVCDEIRFNVFIRLKSEPSWRPYFALLFKFLASLSLLLLNSLLFSIGLIHQT